MGSSSLNKNKEHDRSKSVNNIDDLAAKQEVSYVNRQGWQYKNYHPNPNVRNNPHLFLYSKADNPVDNAHNSQGQNIGYQKPYQGRTYVLSQAQHNQFQNQKQQTAQPTTPSPTTAPQDKIKGLAMMMQQLLQGQKIQGKALNQVTTDINSRMNHMFNDLSTKYDNVASHMRQMDVQIAQTAESVKRQQGTLPGKTDKNPKECNVVALRSGRNLPDTIPKNLSAAEKGKQKEGEQPRSEALPLSDEEPEQSVETDPTPVAPPVEPLNERLISGKVTRDSELLMVSKQCTAVLQNKPIKKLDDPGKFVLSIQIGRTLFACSLCDLGSSVNLMPYSVAKRLGFTNFKPTRLSLVFADRSVKSPVGILEDLHVRVGNTFVPTDFVVLEVEEELSDPL
ncbi:PREDICTED: uncharacterized protein LOC106297976 [Brassica oleracea var. oleracea]|uniref:uncharacterized protein LOC106297976 n=1 Tax=Brassica oleracea var. oleracea TaxID=109376 RepID=UPI0006A6D885|nr:PREDICTED: uncharacterized protein LOC106297976 [Brassica oleracea var. oleracea]